MSNSSIWPINKTLSGATTASQSGPSSDGNEGVLHIPQNLSITWASRSDCLMLYQGHSLGRSYPYAEMQSVYSTAPTDWATRSLVVGVLPLYRDAIRVLYTPSQPGNYIFVCH